MLKQAASAGLLEGTEVLLFTGSTHIEGGAGLKIIPRTAGRTTSWPRCSNSWGAHSFPAHRRGPWRAASWCSIRRAAPPPRCARSGR